MQEQLQRKCCMKVLGLEQSLPVVGFQLLRSSSDFPLYSQWIESEVVADVDDSEFDLRQKCSLIPQTPSCLSLTSTIQSSMDNFRQFHVNAQTGSTGVIIWLLLPSTSRTTSQRRTRSALGRTHTRIQGFWRAAFSNFISNIHRFKSLKISSSILTTKVNSC
jgi:hypothetical protein